MAIEAPYSKYSRTNFKIGIVFCIGAAIIFAYDGYLSKYEWSLRHGFYENHIIGLLFSVDLEFQNDLDKNVLSEQLQQEFEANKILLSQDTSISVEQAGSRWLITDKSKNYSVRKEEDILNIYVKELLFIVDLELQSDLDKSVLPERLQQEFGQNKIPLSQDTSVAVEQAGSRWLITDKSKKYSVSKEEGRLKVYNEGGQPDSTMIFNQKSPFYLVAGAIGFAVLLYTRRNKKIVADENELSISDKKRIPYSSIQRIDKTYFDKKGFFVITYKDKNGTEVDRKISNRKYDNLAAILDHLVARITGQNSENRRQKTD